MRPLFRHLIVAAMWAIAASSETMAETPERRVALVIGNADYQHAARLANTPNDANLIADTLRSLGFTLVGDRALLNLDKAAFDKAIRSFREQLTGGGVGLSTTPATGSSCRASIIWPPSTPIRRRRPTRTSSSWMPESCCARWRPRVRGST